MTELRLPLDWHNGPGIIVETTEEGGVSLTFGPEGEGGNTGADRTLRPEEARALASALRHFAAEVSR